MSCQEILSGIETMDISMTGVVFVQGTPRGRSMVLNGRITLGGGIALDGDARCRKRSEEVRFAGRGVTGGIVRHLDVHESHR